MLEGLMPFANPGGMKRTLLSLAAMEDRTLRRIGLGSMIVGAVLLYFVRSGGL